MKNRLLAFAMLFLLYACQDKEKQPSRLVGKWQLVTVQDTTTTWRDVTPASGVMHIYANGSIEFTTIEGIKTTALGCCGPSPYKANGDDAILLKYFPENCALVYCAALSPSDPPPSFSWRVISVDTQLLEVETGNPSPRRLRYRKLN